jgi:hypothetical protein
MAGITSYIDYSNRSFSYTIQSDLLYIFNGDHIAAAFVDILEELQLDEIAGFGHYEREGMPDKWPSDVWVEADLVAIAAAHMPGVADRDAVQNRVWWLEDLEFIKFCAIHPNSSYGMYWLNVDAINRSIEKRGIAPGLDGFLKKRTYMLEHPNEQ